ncbi:hypothetical protein F4802DRAFT_583444 [Xylaria palmicola]|nr:hypothetical protein F4802DRAFT_583444 [Xylaria palmicola]
MPLPKKDPATAIAKSTISAAFKELANAVSPADSADFESITLDDVRKTALDIENQLAARQLLRNMRRLSPLFSGLQYYSKSIEILCNGTPYLPWLWAPISLILKICSDYVEAFEQIIKAYSRIGESLTRFQVLQESFCNNPAFQQTLAIFYADILELHKAAYKSVQRSSWKLFFFTSWGRFEGRLENIVNDLKRHEEQLDKEANAYNIVEANRMRESLHEWRQESIAKAKRDEEEQHTRQLQAIHSWLKVNDTDQSVIFDQISSEASRHPGACSWILAQPIMASWLSHQTNSPFVWLRGNPGCGKSVISTQVVKFLGTKGSIVVHYFYTSSYSSSTQYGEALKSLLFQMIGYSGQMAAYVFGQYVGKKVASVVLLEQLLQLAVTALSDDLGHDKPIYVVIDGLDDLNVEKQARFLSLMSRVSRDSLCRSNSAPCKVLVASRPTQLVTQCLRKKAIFSLSDEKEKLTDEISRYAQRRLNAYRSRFAELYLQDSDLLDIAHQVAKRADGMFLWARLVLDYLTHNMFFSSQEIRQAVDILPRELSEFYERILTQIIARFDARSIERLRTIFSWIAFGKRPLRRAELRSALLYCAGTTLVQDIAPSYIFDMCAPLVEEHAGSSLRFIHKSVKEHLQKPESAVWIGPDHVCLEHAIATTACFLSGLDVFQPEYPSNDRSIRVLKGVHGFHVYACEHWIDCVLDAVSSVSTEQDRARLISTLSDASQKLAILGVPPTKQDGGHSTSEPRLELLKQFPTLYETAKGFILARNQKQTGAARSHDALRRVSELGDVLDNYQIVLRECLCIQEFPGFTADELAQFRRDHCRTAFTCRFASCFEGFEASEQRAEHEMSHATPLKCPVPSCQYPPYQTEQALRDHKRRCHDDMAHSPPMKSIRRVGKLTKSRSASEEHERRLELIEEGTMLDRSLKVSGANEALDDYNRELEALERKGLKRRMMKREQVTEGATLP